MKYMYWVFAAIFVGVGALDLTVWQNPVLGVLFLLFAALYTWAGFEEKKIAERKKQTQAEIEEMVEEIQAYITELEEFRDAHSETPDKRKVTIEVTGGKE